jgi:dihydropyrimidinase
MTQLDRALRGITIVTASDEFRADTGIRSRRVVNITDGTRLGVTTPPSFVPASELADLPDGSGPAGPNKVRSPARTTRTRRTDVL